MKILWVKAGKLLPVDTGGKIRSFNILRHLAKEHEVTLLSYYAGRRDTDYESALKQQLPLSQTIPTDGPENRWGASLEYLLRLPSPAPFAVRRFTHREVRHAVSQWLNSGRLDVAVCDFLAATQNFPHASPVPIVLFQHNVESMLWGRRARTEESALRKISYSIEAWKMASYEARALRKFRHVIAVSDHDRDAMLSMFPGCPITVVPTGVDTGQYRVVPSASTNPPLVVFTGSMDWEPNIDAMEYFCREIWPAVLAEFPKARFQIVGRTPLPRVQRLASSSVEVTGTVPSIIDYLRSAAVVVVPLRIGGGTRLKIFEAMAMGKALVSTSIGAEGLNLTNGRDAVIADDAPSFASSIVRLLRDPALRQTFEKNAAALAARCDWSQIARQFGEVLRSVTANLPHDHTQPNHSATR